MDRSVLFLLYCVFNTHSLSSSVSHTVTIKSWRRHLPLLSWKKILFAICSEYLASQIDIAAVVIRALFELVDC